MTMKRIAGSRIRIAPEEQALYDAAFSDAYETYHTRVFAFVYSRVRDVELAKDLVATVFERAYAKGHELRERAALGAWLFMIAKNTIAGHYRSAGREANHIERASEQMRFADSPPTPEDVLLREEGLGRLMSQISKLPQRDQELLSLKFDAELTNAEIAEVVGMTPGNVRVAIFRALKRLRNLMMKDAGRSQATGVLA
ncbi:MAG TPA: RNA polymerase sigma factor [Dehalococcoidia bacterium]|nr:RNA polymerase sigma factor [Dehalococcoidia bacterium]